MVFILGGSSYRITKGQTGKPNLLIWQHHLDSFFSVGSADEKLIMNDEASQIVN